MRRPYLRAGLGCATTINFFTFMAQALVVLFASRDLGLSAGVIGLALGVGAVGGLVGAVAAPRLADRYGLGLMVAVGAILFPAPLALLALAGGPTWTAAAVLGVVEFLSGFGVMLFDVNLNALQATVTPDAVRSRVSGAFSTINYGIRPLGALLGGALGAWLGLRPTLVVAAVGGALSVLWLLPSPIPAVRSLADIEPPDHHAPGGLASDHVADRNAPLEPVTAPEPDTLPTEHDRTRRSLLARLVAPLVLLIGIVALVKFGAFVLKFFGIFLAVGGYALIWGWKFGVGVVLLILAHELGHYVEAKRLGLDPQLPVFIPFLGASLALRNMRFDPSVNARVSLAGPVVGGTAAAGCLAAAVSLNSDLLRALAYGSSC